MKEPGDIRAGSFRCAICQSRSEWRRLSWVKSGPVLPPAPLKAWQLRHLLLWNSCCPAWISWVDTDGGLPVCEAASFGRVCAEVEFWFIGAAPDAPKTIYPRSEERRV